MQINLSIAPEKIVDSINTEASEDINVRETLYSLDNSVIVPHIPKVIAISALYAISNLTI